MTRRFPAVLMCSSSVILSSLCFTASATAVRSNLIASIQETSGALMKQAAALLAAGHVVQAATLYLQAGDAALNEHQFGIAEQAYQQAATAFHRANQPGEEATAYEKLAAVFEQEAGVAPAGTGTARPALPAMNVKARTAAPPAATVPQPTQRAPAGKVPITPALPAPSAERPRSGLYECVEDGYGSLLVYGDLRIRDDGTYQGVQHGGANGPVYPYTYAPTTHAVTWKGGLGGDFGNIVKSTYAIDNEGKPDFTINFQFSKDAHEMNCLLNGH
jgi:hypothetical protein